VSWKYANRPAAPTTDAPAAPIIADFITLTLARGEQIASYVMNYPVLCPGETANPEASARQLHCVSSPARPRRRGSDLRPNTRQLRWLPPDGRRLRSAREITDQDGPLG
jgi:hypothetical protein